MLSLTLYGYGQTWDTPIPNDTLFVANQTASDSVYFKRFREAFGGSVTFYFTYVDATDATITFGYSPDGVTLLPVPISPTTTLDNTGTDYVGWNASADTIYCKSYESDNWEYKYIGWWFSKGSLTNDTIPIKFNK